MTEYKDWDTAYILSECREQMATSCDRGPLVDELASRIKDLTKQLSERDAQIEASAIYHDGAGIQYDMQQVKIDDLTKQLAELAAGLKSGKRIRTGEVDEWRLWIPIEQSDRLYETLAALAQEVDKDD